MFDTPATKMAQHLQTMREDLIYRVEALVESPKTPSYPTELRSKTRCFHELLQVGLTASWDLVVHEYRWAVGSLRANGIDWQQHQRLIDTYFDVAQGMRRWSIDELEALETIETVVQQISASAYAETVPAA
jgi:hypothetical protein